MWFEPVRWDVRALQQTPAWPELLKETETAGGDVNSVPSANTEGAGLVSHTANALLVGDCSVVGVASHAEPQCCITAHPSSSPAPWATPVWQNKRWPKFTQRDESRRVPLKLQTHISVSPSHMMTAVAAVAVVVVVVVASWLFVREEQKLTPKLHLLGLLIIWPTNTTALFLFYFTLFGLVINFLLTHFYTIFFSFWKVSSSLFKAFPDWRRTRWRWKRWRRICFLLRIKLKVLVVYHVNSFISMMCHFPAASCSENNMTADILNNKPS